MRLDTKEKRAAMRLCMIPKESVKDARSTDAGEVYVYESGGSPYALAFRGTAAKPEWHYRFRSQDGREQRIAAFFASIKDAAERKATRKAELSSFVHDVKPGDVFRSSWGYDQTNIDYYQVVRLIGEHMAEVREIQQQSQETGFLQGDCVPAPGQWATEADYSQEGEAYKAQHGHYPRKPKAPFRVRIQKGYNGEPYFKVRSFAHASRVKPLAEVAGAKLYAASHWTAYA